MRKGFTLIELLVVIGIVAILAAVAILVLNPAELQRQARDSRRISDMATINSAINFFNVDVISQVSSGVSMTAYISIPDPAATSTAGTDCSGVGPPTSTLPSGWSYHCAASSTYRSVNGLGWIPVDFSQISFRIVTIFTTSYYIIV